MAIARVKLRKMICEVGRTDIGRNDTPVVPGPVMPPLFCAVVVPLSHLDQWRRRRFVHPLQLAVESCCSLSPATESVRVSDPVPVQYRCERMIEWRFESLHVDLSSLMVAHERKLNPPNDPVVVANWELSPN